MAFQDIFFPAPKLIHGMKKATLKPTNIVSNGYTEYRLQRQSGKRFKWTIPSNVMRSADVDVIASFLDTVNFGLDSFKFTCPKDGIIYHVRFDGAGFEEIFEGLNSTNTPVYETVSEIVLVQVLGE